jgi:CheY-like chemotaxis protein
MADAPRPPRDAAGQLAAATPGEVLVDPRILVVDDSPAVHDEVRQALDLSDLDGASFAHFTVDTAFQGAEALERVAAAVAERRPYAVALVDARMPPGWDGLETIGRLAQEDPELQLILCTAFADASWPEVVGQIAPSDGLLVLRKPFDPVEVRQAVHVLSGKWMLARELHLRLGQLARGERSPSPEVTGEHPTAAAGRRSAG